MSYMNEYIGATRRAVRMRAKRSDNAHIGYLTHNEMEATFSSIAAAWRFISGYKPNHWAWSGKRLVSKPTSYDSLQATLKRTGCIHIQFVADGILYRACLDCTE